jgi:hypothetical protein
MGSNEPPAPARKGEMYKCYMCWALFDNKPDLNSHTKTCTGGKA